MSRKRTAFLAIIGMCITIDLINWANHSIGNSATVGIAAGVFMVVAYRLGQWSNHPEDRTQHQPPNPATERGSSHGGAE